MSTNVHGITVSDSQRNRARLAIDSLRVALELVTESLAEMTGGDIDQYTALYELERAFDAVGEDLARAMGTW